MVVVMKPGLVGDTTAVDMDKISINEHVERVMRVQEPFKKANRKFHPEDTVVTVGDAKIGGGNFSVIAGPCSVESEEQICAVAEDVKRRFGVQTVVLNNVGPVIGAHSGPGTLALFYVGIER